jgi:hypothetical protein
MNNSISRIISFLIVIINLSCSNHPTVDIDLSKELNSDTTNLNDVVFNSLGFENESFVEKLNQGDSKLYLDDIEIESILSRLLKDYEKKGQKDFFQLLDSLEYYSGKTDGAGTESLANEIFNVFHDRPYFFCEYLKINRESGIEYLLINQFCITLGLRTDMMNIGQLESTLKELLGADFQNLGKRIIEGVKALDC